MAEKAPIQVRESIPCLLCFLHVFRKYLWVACLREKKWDQMEFWLDLVWLCFHVMRLLLFKSETVQNTSLPIVSAIVAKI